MPRRKELNAIVHNFLVSFGSRNSDHDGYWVFGFVILNLDSTTIDLLADDDPHDPSAIAARIARLRFLQQLEMCGFPRELVRTAHVELRRSKEADRGSGHHISGEYELMMTARVTTDLGKTYSSERSIWVAPHNPEREHRSARWTQ